MSQHFSASLLSRIKAAKSREEVNELLEQGEEFEFVHEATQRRWKRAAKRKLQTFEKRKQ